MTALEFIQDKQAEHKETHGVYADVDTKIAEWCEEYSQLQLYWKSLENSDIDNPLELIPTQDDIDMCVAQKWHNTWKYQSEFPANIMSFIKGMQHERKISFTDKHLVMMFAYGHQIGMNSVLAIQSKHGPQPTEVPDTDKLRDEMIEFFKKEKS